MPSLKTIRKRIASVKSTQKITRAMKMVAGAKLNRAQQRITALRPYAVKTAEMVRSVARATVEEVEDAQDGGQLGAGPAAGQPHPLMVRRPERNVLMLVITADRGLCGAFNTNVGKAAEAAWHEHEAQGRNVQFATIGRKGRDYLARRQGKMLHHFQRGREDVSLELAGNIARWLIDRYRAAEFDAIYVVFSEFKSPITQKPVVDRLLPLSVSDTKPAPEGGADEQALTYLFEPNKDRVLDRLAPMYMEISMYRALLENQAGFFGAQMTAMDAATRNAKDAIARYTLQYNRARQAAITKELMEIIGGAEALKD
ncbi:MAG TPA: ATP synthase F1 subunit gamma [Polyangiaceae bacterium]|nr:ATP synthase F1 subunit gamma [Polyangiaceae bacterium]